MAKMYIGKNRIAGGGGTKVEANVDIPSSATKELTQVKVPWFTQETENVEAEEPAIIYIPHQATHERFKIRATEEEALSFITWLDDPYMQVTKELMINSDFMSRIPAEYKELVEEVLGESYTYSLPGSMNNISANWPADMQADLQFINENTDKAINGGYMVVDDELYVTGMYDESYRASPSVKDIFEYDEGKIEAKDIKVAASIAPGAFLIVPLKVMLLLDLVFDGMDNGKIPEGIRKDIDDFDFSNKAVLADGLLSESTIDHVLDNRDYFDFKYDNLSVDGVEVKTLDTLKIGKTIYKVSQSSTESSEEAADEEVSELEIRRLLRASYPITVNINFRGSPDSGVKVSEDSDKVIWDTETATVNILNISTDEIEEIAGADCVVEQNEGFVTFTLANARADVTINVLATGLML